MTAKRLPLRWLLAALAALAVGAALAALSGCASSQKARAVAAVDAAAQLHRETMREAGYAAAVGRITEPELQRLRAAGVAAEQAIRSAKASLELLLAAPGLTTEAGWRDAAAALQTAMAEMLRLAGAAGVGVPDGR